ncbi:MAG TPA: hypothetical protein DCS93_22445, partial [Microscillaceae bacterium]|nr:hypothetical protein [Microscillaceae bacterium]
FSYRFWNLLYTQKDLYADDGTKFPSRDRITFFTSQHQFAYGLSENVNIEAEVWLKSTRIDLPENSPLQVYRFTDTDSARTALAYAGAGIRWRPNKKNSRLSIGSKFLLPVTQNLESQNLVQPFLAEDHFWWINTIFYDTPIADNLYTFFQAGATISIPKNSSEQASIVRFPFRGILSYFTSKVLSVNLQAGFTLNNQSRMNGYWGDLGLGLRWQIAPGVLELQGEYQKYVIGKNQGAGETFNFGLRWIRF